MILIREQFPLIQAWATTIHKVQGASLSQAVISIGNNVFENEMAYIALSRINKLSGLYLLASNYQKVTPPPPPPPCQSFGRVYKTSFFNRIINH